jgi:hypothetical protein
MSDKQPFTPPCPLHTAVLFLIYKRPDTTRQVFEAIRQAKPPRLYVAADGPKAEVPGEAERVQQARDIILNGVDWNCEVKTLFRDTNLGCKYGVSGGITWFFEQEDEGIILEDDTLPSQSFFWFCQELLERYRDDERIMCISAQHFHGDAHKIDTSYVFSRYNHCWGWASWQRAWNLFDIDMKIWPKVKDSQWLRGIGDGNRLFDAYWKKLFDAAYNNMVDSWAYCWTFSCWAQSGLSIHPSVNLIRNIGFGLDATHTNNSIYIINRIDLENVPFPLKHPAVIVRDVPADNWIDCHFFKITMTDYVKSILKQLPFGSNIFQCARRIRTLLQKK